MQTFNRSIRHLRSVNTSQARHYSFAPRPFHSEYNADLEEQIFTLPDDRKVGFAQYGDASGHPLIVFHGAPGSRYDGVGFHDKAKKLGIRIICPDRPGHGYSSPQPDRKLSDYAADISALATHLNLPQYDILGISGGGPYVAACAYVASQAPNTTPTLRNSMICAGMGHPSLVKPSIAGWYTTLALGFTGRFPNFATRLADSLYGPNFWHNEEKIKQTMLRMGKLLPKAEREKLLADLDKNGGEGWDALIGCLQCAYAQGARGTYGDSKIFWEDWDFELKDVKKKVVLLYGDADHRTPVAFGRHYQKEMQDTEYIELMTAGHFSMQKFDSDMLRKAVGIAIADVKEETIENGTKWTLEESSKPASQTDTNSIAATS